MKVKVIEITINKISPWRHPLLWLYAKRNKKRLEETASLMAGMLMDEFYGQQQLVHRLHNEILDNVNRSSKTLIFKSYVDEN